MNNQKILCSWSGGKDSCFALIRAIEMGYTPVVLLNVLNESGKLSRSHGIPEAILQAQGAAAGIPVHCISSSWKEYEYHFTNALVQLKEQYGSSHAVFGDIDLQPHRDWEEMVCNRAGLEPLLPLWQQDRKQLVLQMLDAGIETIIVSCNEKMGESFLGRRMTPALVEELDALGVDACGENGEFHTLVLDCPLFRQRLQVSITEKLLHEGYWFSVLQQP